MAAETHERSFTSKDDETDFVDYLAKRLGVETREARERLSAWLIAYEAPPRSGVRKAVPDSETPPFELERSA